MFFKLLFLSLTFLNIFALNAEGPKDSRPKILMLIISSDNLPVYSKLQRIWKSYMNTDPEHVEAYFIRGDENLPCNHLISKNNILLQTAESLKPGITSKTLMSLEALYSRLDEFDFVIRTNLSSFYIFPRLLRFLKYYPRENFYGGVRLYIPQASVAELGEVYFASGAGIILTPDLCKMLVNEKAEIEKYSSLLFDDVLIGHFFQIRGIGLYNIPRFDIADRADWLKKKNQIPLTTFHIRAKKSVAIRTEHDNPDDEIFILQELLTDFYPTANCQPIKSCRN